MTTETIIVSKPSTPKSLKDLSFGEAGQDTVVLPITKTARLKWFNAAATDQQTFAIGWHIDAGVNPYIDETLQGMGMHRYIIEHQNPDKDGITMKSYWHLEICSLIIICEGLLTTFQMHNTDRRTGIAYAEEIEHDEHGQAKRYEDGQQNIVKHKVLKFRAFVHEMVLHGYNEWFEVTLSGNMVKEMIDKALVKQVEVLKAFTAYTGLNAPFYGFSVPLVPSSTRKMVGPEKKRSPIYPMLASIPETIDEAYLLEHAVSEGFVN